MKKYVECGFSMKKSNKNHHFVKYFHLKREILTIFLYIQGGTKKTDHLEK